MRYEKPTKAYKNTLKVDVQSRATLSSMRTDAGGCRSMPLLTEFERVAVN